MFFVFASLLTVGLVFNAEAQAQSGDSGLGEKDRPIVGVCKTYAKVQEDLNPLNLTGNEFISGSIVTRRVEGVEKFYRFKVLSKEEGFYSLTLIKRSTELWRCSGDNCVTKDCIPKKLGENAGKLSIGIGLNARACDFKGELWNIGLIEELDLPIRYICKKNKSANITPVSITTEESGKEGMPFETSPSNEILNITEM